MKPVRLDVLRVAVLALVCALPAAAEVLELGQYAFMPTSVVPDGKGGSLLFARTYDRPILVRLSADGKAVWAKEPAIHDGVALVPTSDDSAVLVWQGRGRGEVADVWASRIDLDGTAHIRRRYAAPEGVAVSVAGGGYGRVALVLLSAQSESIFMLDEELSAVRQFGFDHIQDRYITSVAVAPDEGAVFAGIDRGVCFVGRIDATGGKQWIRRYRLDEFSGCSNVAMTSETIYVGGWRNHQSEIVLMALEPDGRLRWAVKTTGAWSPAALSASDRGAVIVVQRDRGEIRTLVSRFGSESAKAVWEAGLNREFAVLPWGVAAASNTSGDTIFAALNDIRALVVPESVDDPVAECDRFVEASADWERLEVSVEPLNLPVAGFDLTLGVKPPLEYEDIPVQVKRCRRTQ